jgi:O-antigen ligase
MRLLQAVTIGLIALTIAPGYLFYFDVTPKVVVLLAGTAALLAAGAVRGASKSFSALILLNLASLAVSTALSTRPGLSLMGTNWREFGLVPQAAALLFAWSVAGCPGNARVVLRGVAISSAAAGTYGIAQYFGWDPFLPAAAYHIGEGIWTIVRPPGTLGYVSYFATWLAVGAFLSLALETMETASAWQWSARAAAAICAAAMVLTGTRAAMLGLAAGALAWLYLRGFRLTRRMMAGVAAVILLAAAFYFSPPGWNLRSRTRWFTEDRLGGGRPELWRDTLRMASRRLAAGYGPETFTAGFARFESPELAAAYPDFEYESPHNMFLDALTAQGIPGFAALVALCAAGLIAAFRARNAESPYLAAALMAGLVSQQFTGFTIPTAVIVYTTIGLACGRPQMSLASPAREGTRQASFEWALGKLKHALPLALALAMLYCAVRLTVADAALARAQRALETGDGTAAAAQYGRYERWRFPGASADMWYSRASLQLAQKAQQPAVRLQALLQAQAAASRAPLTANDPFDAWYNLAAFDAMRGDLGGHMGNDSAAVERDLRASIAARPNWFKPHWALARLLSLEARREEAGHEAELAVTLDGGKDAEVTHTLAEIRAYLH